VLQGFLGREYLWVLVNAGFIIEVAVMIYAVQYAVDLLITRFRAKIGSRSKELPK
jgi:hypothetical protein